MSCTAVSAVRRGVPCPVGRAANNCTGGRCMVRHLPEGITREYQRLRPRSGRRPMASRSRGYV
eukprot:6320709-Prymnesium_polylepis.1